jgi:hypothetical protein
VRTLVRCFHFPPATAVIFRAPGGPPWPRRPGLNRARVASPGAAFEPPVTSPPHHQVPGLNLSNSGPGPKSIQLEVNRPTPASFLPVDDFGE